MICCLFFFLVQKYNWTGDTSSYKEQTNYASDIKPGYILDLQNNLPLTGRRKDVGVRGSFKCFVPLCNKAFSHKRSLRRHVTQVHSLKELRSCGYNFKL